MKVIGFRKSEFTAQDTGELIKGYNLYLAGPQDHVEGVACERVFLSEKKMDGYTPSLEDEVRVSYNRYGKVQSIEQVG